MNPVEEALEALYAALASVDGVRLHRGVGVLVDPPGVTVGPPKLLWELPGEDPSSALFQVAVLVKQDQDAMTELFRHGRLVWQALHGLQRGAVRKAEPGVWPAGGVSLPAYLIDVDYAL